MRVFFVSIAILLFVSGCATDKITENPTVNTWTNDPIAQKIIQTEDTVQANNIKVYDDLWERIRLGFDIPDPNLEIINKHVRQLKAKPIYVNR